MITVTSGNYNILSNNRELQQERMEELKKCYYNILSNNRELQPFLLPMRYPVIITY